MENILIGFNVSLLFSLSQTYQIYFHERLLFLTNVEQITNVNKRVIFFANNNKRLVHLTGSEHFSLDMFPRDIPAP